MLLSSVLLLLRAVDALCTRCFCALSTLNPPLFRVGLSAIIFEGKSYLTSEEWLVVLNLKRENKPLLRAPSCGGGDTMFQCYEESVVVELFLYEIRRAAAATRVENFFF